MASWTSEAASMRAAKNSLTAASLGRICPSRPLHRARRRRRPRAHRLLLRGRAHREPARALRLGDERHQLEPLLDRSAERGERRRCGAARPPAAARRAAPRACRPPRAPQPRVEVARAPAAPAGSHLRLEVAGEGAEDAEAARPREPARRLERVGHGGVGLAASSARAPRRSARAAAARRPGSRRRASRSRCPPALTTMLHPRRERIEARVGSPPRTARPRPPSPPAAEAAGERALRPHRHAADHHVEAPGREVAVERGQRNGTQRDARPRSRA